MKERPTGGTYSKSSISSKNGIFFTDMGDGLFSSEYRGVLEWKISFEENENRGFTHDKKIQHYRTIL